jgi:hypothetical protein
MNPQRFDTIARPGLEGSLFLPLDGGPTPRTSNTYFLSLTLVFHGAVAFSLRSYAR